jgi:hypothetical protein
MLCVLCLLLLTCTTYHSVSRVLVSDLALLNTARFVSSELSALLYSVLLHKSGGCAKSFKQRNHYGEFHAAGLISYKFLLQVGIPRHSVAEKLVAEGLVASEKLALELLQLDPSQRIPEKFFRVPSYNMDSLIPVAEHPQYKKFFKMLKVRISCRHVQRV